MCAGSKNAPCDRLNVLGLHVQVVEPHGSTPCGICIRFHDPDHVKSKPYAEALDPYVLPNFQIQATSQEIHLVLGFVCWKSATTHRRAYHLKRLVMLQVISPSMGCSIFHRAPECQVPKSDALVTRGQRDRCGTQDIGASSVCKFSFVAVIWLGGPSKVEPHFSDCTTCI